MSYEDNLKKLHSIFQEIYEKSTAEGTVKEYYYNDISSFFKKRILPKEQYLDQLEKNVPYMKFYFNNTLSELIDYIYNPIKNENSTEAYTKITSSAKSNAILSSYEVINYFKSNSQNNHMTNDFIHLKNLKDNNKFEELFEELEFQIKYYKSNANYMNYIAFIITQNIEIMQFISSNFSKGDTMEKIRIFTKDFVNDLLAVQVIVDKSL